MAAKKRTEPHFQPRELDSIIARARRDRDAALRNMIGSLFGR
jgi:hypothetical protein